MANSQQRQQQKRKKHNQWQVSNTHSAETNAQTKMNQMCKAMLTIKSLAGSTKWNAYGCEVNCTCSKILCACERAHTRTHRALWLTLMVSCWCIPSPLQAHTHNICYSVHFDSFENFRCTHPLGMHKHTHQSIFHTQNDHIVYLYNV